MLRQFFRNDFKSASYFHFCEHLFSSLNLRTMRKICRNYYWKGPLFTLSNPFLIFVVNHVNFFDTNILTWKQIFIEKERNLAIIAVLKRCQKLFCKQNGIDFERFFSRAWCNFEIGSPEFEYENKQYSFSEPNSIQ